jgi:hypothetical protein
MASMAQVLKFDEAIGRGNARKDGRSGGEAAPRGWPAEREPDDFWPEVSSGLWVSKEPILPDPGNSPGRVFTEVFLILGGVGLLVLLTTVFLGVPQ